MTVFDRIIELIFEERRELCINVDCHDPEYFVPRVFYIGRGKTGSTSIKNGFGKINTAHWHNLRYFERIYDCQLLSSNGYDLYDLIFYIGKKYSFKPLIIESIREPVSLEISRIFQHIKFDRKHGDECELCKIGRVKNAAEVCDGIGLFLKCNLKSYTLPYSVEMFEKHFDFDLRHHFDKTRNHYFTKTKDAHLLILKYENIDEWESIVSSLSPHKFTLRSHNRTKDPLYDVVRKRVKFTNDELQFIYDKDFDSFYSSSEKSKFIRKWKL